MTGEEGGPQDDNVTAMSTASSKRKAEEMSQNEDEDPKNVKASKETITIDAISKDDEEKEAVIMKTDQEKKDSKKRDPPASSEEKKDVANIIIKKQDDGDANGDGGKMDLKEDGKNVGKKEEETTTTKPENGKDEEKNQVKKKEDAEIDGDEKKQEEMEVDGDGNGNRDKSKDKKESETSKETVKQKDETTGDQETPSEETKEQQPGEQVAVTPEEEKKDKNPYDSLKWITIMNDSKPGNLIKLVALKSLFAKQLPKMPRTYIARLVFDRRHTSLAIVSDDPALKDTDEEVIGSICYRAFPKMRFAEIAFCAVNASHQVKGYGTKLMNLLKREGARTGIEYFITYADNYAIGYFKKQGFTKTISMPKGRYQGLIKDYDGGTMMECYVHPSIDFTRIPEMLAVQRKFILDRVRLKANSNKVYESLPKNFSPGLEGVSRANEAAARAMAIPGMVEAGWTMTDLLAATGQGKDVDRAKNQLKSELLSIVRKVEEQQFAWPFREPVDTSEVQDYLDIIKIPIDLQTIEKRIRKGDHYKSKQMLYADLMLMVNNCKLYNEEVSTYVQCAVSLDKYLGSLFRDMAARN